MYHYTECGLDNVWLENGYTSKDTPYGPATAVTDVDGLHRAIALILIEKAGKLTGKELRFMRTQLGLSQGGMAKLIGVTEQSFSLWERHGKVPQYADVLARVLIHDKFAGQGKIQHLIERISTVERLCHQRIVVKERGNLWRSKLLDTPDEVAIAA